MKTLWIPGRLPGLNEIIDASKGAGGTGRKYAAIKRKLTNDIALLAKVAKLGQFRRLFIEFYWREKDRRRDPDNVAAGGRKFAIDGLVAAGVIRNDGWTEIAGWSDRFQVSDEPGVLLCLFEQEFGTLPSDSPF